MARALIVACGCRGRELGRALLACGWQVRGTTRDPDRARAIADAGIETALGDPQDPASILDHIGDVALLYWLLGSAAGEPDAVAGVNGRGLERVLEEIVETPVRGFVYEAAGRVGQDVLRGGAERVREAGERWRIPVDVVNANPGDWPAWRERMLAAGRGLVDG